MEEHTSLGMWVRRRRKALDLTQQELAALVGCSADLVRKIEADARRPSKQVALLLAEQLQLTADESALFVQAARAALPVQQLPLPVASVPRPPLTTAVSSPPRTPTPHNLPPPPNELLGRTQELSDLRVLLGQPDVRLVTLTGPGGIGKTRLALAMAAELLEEEWFPDGIWFVPLAKISEPDLVAATIAHTLHVPDLERAPAEERLGTYLRARRLLLLLDNFEHILAATPLISLLLTTAPGLRALVTSRAVLHLYSEYEYSVPPLDLPDTSQTPSFEQLASSAAVQLFVARAQAVKRTFVLTQANALAVAAICQQLDGLPLAIELAATRTKLFDPKQLLAYLQSASSVTLLSGGARDLAERQQTLRATIAWSYHLLSPSEQQLFRRLGVFVGGCTAAAATYLADDQDEPAPTAAIVSPDLTRQLATLETLSTLIDHSLLRQEAGVDGEPRFWMLETVRAYAQEQLEACGERIQTERRHGLYVLALAEQANGAINGPDEQVWLERLDADVENIRAVLSRILHALEKAPADGSGMLELGLRLATTLADYWTIHNRQREGRAWIEQLLVHWQGDASALAPLLVAQAWYAAGYIATAQGDVAEANNLLEQSLELYRAANDEVGFARTLLYLGRNARMQQDYERAEQLEAQALLFFRQHHMPLDTVIALVSLGDVFLETGALARAADLLEEALALVQRYKLGNDGIWALYNLGRTAYLQGDMAGARTRLETALAQFRQLNYTLGEGQTLMHLGRVLYAQGEDQLAASHFARCLVLFGKTQFDATMVADTLEGIAAVAARQGNQEAAAQLLGAAAALRQSLGSALEPAYRPAYEALVAAVSTALGPQAFATAWNVGQALGYQQAIDAALALATAFAPPPLQG